jgi:cysteinyl-tRNA synthetase
MSAQPFRIYNSFNRQLEPFTPIEEGKVRLYVCGMTVYDNAHIGHARAMVVFDAFVRYLRFRGWDVNFVRNFTDVDDKIIRRAAEQGMEPMELAEKYIRHFRRDADALGLIEPDSEPRVSTSIQDIIDMIQNLIDKGHAYESEGSVWFNVPSFKAYGGLSGQKVDALQSADTVAGKQHPADFALWKAVKPGEPFWDSPFGPGRPGWHIECSAMSKCCLGEEIDIHGGGLDLVFPHHENEIAQSEASSGKKFSRYWMHNGLLTMKGGQKMGKSLGNVINIEDALQDYPAEAVRIYLLQNHYRSPLPWSGEALDEALAMLARLYEAIELAESFNGQERAEDVAKSLGEDAQTVLDLGTSFQEKMLNFLDEDFNTSGVLGLAFELARAINRFAAHKKAKKRGGPLVVAALEGLRSMNAAIGLLGADAASFQDEVKQKCLRRLGLDATQVEAQLAARQEARANKDWATSDQIRDELDAQGILIMDTADGVEWRVKLG